MCFKDRQRICAEIGRIINRFPNFTDFYDIYGYVKIWAGLWIWSREAFPAAPRRLNSRGVSLPGAHPRILFRIWIFRHPAISSSRRGTPRIRGLTGLIFRMARRGSVGGFRAARFGSKRLVMRIHGPPSASTFSHGFLSDRIAIRWKWSSAYTL